MALSETAAVRAEPPTDPGAAGAPAAPVPAAPQESIFSSFKQAFKQDYDHEVVRGHFDVGAASDTRRYYCLVEPKTGKRQPNGVPGQPVPRPDGMTGIKATSVSTYSCDSAEQQGSLVTTGYVLSGAASAGNSAPPRPAAPPAPVQSQPTVAVPPLPEPQSPSLAHLPLHVTDISGLKLGMSPEEVRAVLRNKRLLNYQESSATLGQYDPGQAAAPSMASRRFVNVIVAWTARTAGPAAVADGSAESYEVMFTPVPGEERAMGIVHSVGLGAGIRLRESALKSALFKKYGGFAAAESLADSSTWRYQSDGSVQLGDGCARRTVFGGLGEVQVGSTTRANVALQTPPNEFQYQVDSCGVVILTEDHTAGAANTAHDQRLVTRYTVSAYSPSIGFEGATSAAQVIQRLGPTGPRADGSRPQEEVAPTL